MRTVDLSFVTPDFNSLFTSNIIIVVCDVGLTLGGWMREQTTFCVDREFLTDGQFASRSVAMNRLTPGALEHVKCIQ